MAADILEEINSGTGFLNLNTFYNVRLLKFESGTTLTYITYLSPPSKKLSICGLCSVCKLVEEGASKGAKVMENH